METLTHKTANEQLLHDFKRTVPMVIKLARDLQGASYLDGNPTRSYDSNEIQIFMDKAKSFAQHCDRIISKLHYAVKFEKEALPGMFEAASRDIFSNTVSSSR